MCILWCLNRSQVPILISLRKILLPAVFLCPSHLWFHCNWCAQFAWQNLTIFLNSHQAVWLLGPRVTFQCKISVRCLLGETSIFYSDWVLAQCDFWPARTTFLHAWTAEIGKYMKGRDQQDQWEWLRFIVKRLGPSMNFGQGSSALTCTASNPLKMLVSKCQVCRMRSVANLSIAKSSYPI